jgi:hypothetical protein
MSPERNASTRHVSRFLFALNNSGSLAIFTAILRAPSGFDSSQSLDLPTCFKWRGGEQAVRRKSND